MHRIKNPHRRRRLQGGVLPDQLEGDWAILAWLFVWTTTGDLALVRKFKALRRRLADQMGLHAGQGRAKPGVGPLAMAGSRRVGRAQSPERFFVPAVVMVPADRTRRSAALWTDATIRWAGRDLGERDRGLFVHALWRVAFGGHAKRSRRQDDPECDVPCRCLHQVCLHSHHPPARQKNRSSRPRFPFAKPGRDRTNLCGSPVGEPHVPQDRACPPWR